VLHDRSCDDSTVSVSGGEGRPRGVEHRSYRNIFETDIASTWREVATIIARAAREAGSAPENRYLLGFTEYLAWNRWTKKGDKMCSNETRKMDRPRIVRDHEIGVRDQTQQLRDLECAQEVDHRNAGKGRPDPQIVLVADDGHSRAGSNQLAGDVGISLDGPTTQRIVSESVPRSSWNQEHLRLAKRQFFAHILGQLDRADSLTQIGHLESVPSKPVRSGFVHQARKLIAEESARNRIDRPLAGTIENPHVAVRNWSDEPPITGISVSNQSEIETSGDESCPDRQDLPSSFDCRALEEHPIIDFDDVVDTVEQSDEASTARPAHPRDSRVGTLRSNPGQDGGRRGDVTKARQADYEDLFMLHGCLHERTFRVPGLPRISADVIMPGTSIESEECERGPESCFLHGAAAIVPEFRLAVTAVLTAR
jgi:hypothetical protein